MTCRNCGTYLDPYKTSIVACPKCGIFINRQKTAKRKTKTIAAAKPKAVKLATALPRRKTRSVRKRRHLPIKAKHLLPVALILLLAIGGGALALKQSPVTSPKSKPRPVIHLPAAFKKQSQSFVTSPTPPAVSSPTIISTPTPAPAKTTPVKAAPVVTTPAPVIPPAQQCTKDNTYQPADPLPISSSSPGLAQKIDSPQYYTVYGYTASDIRVQINACTPLGGGTATHYDGETTWNLDYAYNLNPATSPDCAISSVAVGLHVAFVYPSWTATPYAAAGLSTQWQNFIANLTTHEVGHKDIAAQYANQLYNGLQNFPDTACNNMASQVNSYGDSVVNSLNQAEADYDTQTNHGQTQGAVFP